MFKWRKRRRRQEFHIPKKELKRLYYDLSWTMAQIGEHYGCSISTVHQRMKEYGLKTRHVSDYQRIDIPCAELRELYVVRDWTAEQVATHYGCDSTTIRRKLHGCGIPIHPSRGRPCVEIPCAELRELYLAQEWTTAQIAIHYDRSDSTINRWFRKCGIPTRPPPRGHRRVEIPCTELRKLYVAQEWEQDQIAAHYDRSCPTISRWLYECGIPTRPPRWKGPPPVVHVPPKVLAAWPSPSLAYVVGLITADGNLQKGNNVVRLALTDYELLQHYRACLQSNSTIKTRKKQLDSTGQKRVYEIAFSDRAYRAFLERLGLTPAKSLTLGPLAIPSAVFPDFARGCWDGDGGWHIRRRYKSLRAYLTSGSPAFLTWMKECIQRQTGLQGGISGVMLRYNGPKAVALGHWMYYAPDLPALTRKRAVWEQFT